MPKSVTFTNVHCVQDKTTPGELVVRSYIFVVLCLTWTYVVGVPHMVILLSTTSRPPSCMTTSTKHGKRTTQTNIVQSFYPCQMRFAVVLFLSRWQHCAFFVVAGFILGVRSVSLQNAAESIPEQVASSNVHPEYACVRQVVPTRLGIVDTLSSIASGDKGFVGSSPPWHSTDSSVQLPTTYATEAFTGDPVQIKRAPMYSFQDKASSSVRSSPRVHTRMDDEDVEAGGGGGGMSEEDVQEMFLRASAAAKLGRNI